MLKVFACWGAFPVPSQTLAEHLLEEHGPETIVLVVFLHHGYRDAVRSACPSAHHSGSGVSRTSPSKKSATVVHGRGGVGFRA